MRQTVLVVFVLVAAMAAALMTAVALLIVGTAEPAQAGSFPGKNGRIAFLTTRDGNQEIYSMKSDGTDQTNLTKNPRNDEAPSYSPTGKKIGYAGEDAPNGDFEIYTIKPGGGGKVPLTDNSMADYDSACSPSWKRIASAA